MDTVECAELQNAAPPSQRVRRYRLPKTLGVTLLVWYLVNHAVVFNPLWVPVPLLISIAAAVISMSLIEPVVDGICRVMGSAKRTDPSEINPTHDPRVDMFADMPLVDLLLTPGEDGLFLVPLLVAGANAVSAAVVAVLFAAAHLRIFKPRECIAKALAYYLICLVVLPHGLLTVVAGHVLVDGLAVAFFRGVRKARMDPRGAGTCHAGIPAPTPPTPSDDDRPPGSEEE
ncbi:MAG: hypothetical protein ACYS9X_20505 [Planctomycetota bacterium]